MEPADCYSSSVSDHRAGRHRHRARGDSLPLWPSAGNTAGDLRPESGAAAGGTHAVQPAQPLGDLAGVDQRHPEHQPGAVDHLYPSVHPAVRAGGVLRPDAGHEAHQPRPQGPRRLAEPRHGPRRGRAFQLDRRPDLWPGLRYRRGRRGRAVADHQRRPQPRPGLHHRLVHGGGIRRRG